MEVNLIMNVKIFQFNGCNKCFNESLLLKSDSSLDIELIKNPKEWEAEKVDVAIITGYILPEDREILSTINSNADKIIAYGDCTTTGGIFGLANQKGANIIPITRIIPDCLKVNGCLAEIEELSSLVKGEKSPNSVTIDAAAKHTSVIKAPKFPSEARITVRDAHPPAIAVPKPNTRPPRIEPAHVTGMFRNDDFSSATNPKNSSIEAPAMATATATIHACM